MLIPQLSQHQACRRHGSRPASLGELRRQLARPLELADSSRQRLLELEGRLARVRRLGDEYARVDLSELVKAAMDRQPVTV
ncbi:MAG: hypothetical protein ACE15C_07760 [Phycisphaerae bacterium]